MQRQHSVLVAMQCNIMDRITETQTRYTPSSTLRREAQFYHTVGK